MPRKLTTEERLASYERKKIKERERLKQKREQDPLFVRLIHIKRNVRVGTPIFRKEPIDTQIEEAGRMPEGVEWRISKTLPQEFENRYLELREASITGKPVKWNEKIDSYLLINKYINNEVNFVD